MHENWKPIPGYEGLYEVSNMGRVKSLGRSYKMRNSRKPGVIMDCRKKERILKPGGKGYQQVMLYAADGSTAQPLVHRLVLMAFAGDCPGAECNHKNGDKQDNRLVNLEWVTHRENLLHRGHVLGKAVRERCGRAKLTEARVMELRRAYASGELITPFAREFGVSVTAACNAAKGKTWQTVPMP